MKVWQKTWLIIALMWSSLHLLRDVSQDLGIQNILSTPFVKYAQYTSASMYWWIFFNTYVYELTVLFLSIYCLKRQRFGKLGYATVLLTAIIFVAWLVFWFIL